MELKHVPCRDMKTAGVSEIKKELGELSAKELVELCMNLARYKKDNKEYLAYLLFDAHDKSTFTAEVKKEMDELYAQIDVHSNLYYVKKSLRKILRLVIRYCRYLDDKAAAAELHIYFCFKLKNSGIQFHKSQLILNLYEQELKKINVLIRALHEDLQNDYAAELEKIAL